MNIKIKDGDIQIEISDIPAQDFTHAGTMKAFNEMLDKAIKKVKLLRDEEA